MIKQQSISRPMWWLLGAIIVALVQMAQANAASFKRKASIRQVSTLSKNPDNPELYGSKSEVSSRTIIRDDGRIKFGRNLRIEYNVYSLFSGSSDKESISQLLFNGSGDQNRSQLLERKFVDDEYTTGLLVVDSLNLGVRFGAFNATIGRFPINLSVTTLFTPNDLFAPYRAFEFYREYKMGVDAVKIETSIGNLGSFSIFGVAGYRTRDQGSLDPDPNQGKYSPEDASAVARIVYNLGGFELGLLGGKKSRREIVGSSLQGELLRVGLRAEAHTTRLKEDNIISTTGNFGLEIRPWANVLFQLEQYYQGAGARNIYEYRTVFESMEQDLNLVAQHYTGTAVIWGITPIWQWKGLVTFNHADQSAMVAQRLSMAASENSEINISYISPRGKGASTIDLNSEFGSFPSMITFESSFYW